MIGTYSPSDSPGPVCILTIDDDDTVRSSVKFFLEDHDYQVLEAADGAKGLELFQANRPDLILLDLRMPELNGLEFLKLVRRVDTEIPVIVISGTGKIDDVIEALRQGASDFLLKPIEDLLVLQYSIDKALEKYRLQQENLKYHNHLEEIIAQRTAALEQTYKQLAQSEEKYRSIYENLQDIYFETSLDGVLLEISPSLEKVSQYKRKDLLGTNIWKLNAIPEQHTQMHEVLKHKGRIEDFEILQIDADGRQVFFSVNAMLHLDSSGKPTHISGIMRDISGRKIAEEALRTTNQTLEVLFNAAPLAIMAIDTDLRITLWNKMAEEIFGWKNTEIIGQPYPLAAPGKEEESINNLHRALNGEPLKGRELVRRHKNGKLINISASTAPLGDMTGSICGAIIIIEDISEKHRLRSEADRYSRLASLGELAAGVAHEINNPNGLILLNLPTVREFVMDAIKLQQEQLVTQPDLKLGGLRPARASEAFPQLMSEVEESARRIKQIVEDLKEFAAQGSPAQDEIFDLNQSVKTAVRLTANHLKKATTHFSTQLADGLPQPNGSAQRIEQVIINLLLNACEALTDWNQKIRIETGQDTETNEIYLKVSDEGCGIPPESLSRVTDPFFTTKRESGGTGLGLSVSARIIKEYNGRLEFTSEPDRGTTAKLCFPQAGGLGDG